MTSAPKKPAAQGRGWRIVVAGVGACLTLAVLLLANARALIQGDPARRAPPSALLERRPASLAPRAVLIVIDAVGAQDAFNPSLMPNLVARARNGGSGIAVVESLMPSTVAGIHSLATAVASPPLSIFEDFGALGAPHGGIFEATRAAGRRSYVVGPQLWVDLYGRWIDESLTIKTIGSDDAYLTEAALKALARRDLDLLVIHLGALDEATHRFGGRSSQYQKVVRRSDVFLGRLLGRIPADTAVLITSDHGVTTAGGHVGPERRVLETPLVALGPGLPHGNLGRVRQTDVPRLLLRSIGLRLAEAAPAAGSSFPTRTLIFALLAILAVASALRLWASAFTDANARGRALLLVGGLAVAVTLTVYRHYTAAAGVGLFGLVVAAYLSRPAGWGWTLTMFAVATAFGVLRLVDAHSLSEEVLTTSYRSLAITFGPGIAIGAVVVVQGALVTLFVGRPSLRATRLRWLVGRVRPRWVLGALGIAGAGYLIGGLPLAVVAGGGIAGGAALGAFVRGSKVRAFTLGTTFFLAAIALGRVLGETVSLSSTDVRAAYDLVDGPVGLGGAATVYAIRMILPTLALLLGAAPWLTRASPRVLGCFAAGLAIAAIGQVLAATFLLALPSGQFIWTSLAVSAALRAAGELLFFFVGLGLIWPLGLTRRKRSPFTGAAAPAAL